MKDISNEKFVPLQQYKLMTAVAIILTIILVGIFMTTSIIHECEGKRHFDDVNSTTTIPEDTTIGSDINVEGNLRLVRRDEWLAEPVNAPMDKLILPVHRVIIAHTATENCASQAACTFRTRVIQSFHINSRGFSDIAYNFLVGGDGSVYEGRGWDMQGAHTRGYNVDSIGIAFIGTFITTTPPEKQLNAAKLIIEEGIRLNKLVSDYRLYGANQFVRSSSKPSALYEIIKSWPNWSESI